MVKSLYHANYSDVSIFLAMKILPFVSVDPLYSRYIYCFFAYQLLVEFFSLFQGNRTSYSYVYRYF